jgi:hypothetical protein
VAESEDGDDNDENNENDDKRFLISQLERALYYSSKPQCFKLYEAKLGCARFSQPEFSFVKLISISAVSSLERFKLTGRQRGMFKASEFQYYAVQ